MDIDQIRRRNARALAARYKSQAAFAAAIGRASAQVNHLIGPNAIKAIGKKIARDIEDKLGLPEFWMDSVHDEDGEPVGLLPAPTVGEYRSPPIVGTAQLGSEGYWMELEYPAGHGDGYVDAPSNDENAYALRVVGDSMAPAIKSGWLVVVEPNKTCVPGEYVLVVMLDGRVMVKELLAERTEDIYLLSVNQDNPPMTLQRSDVEKMHHIGFVAPPSKVRM